MVICHAYTEDGPSVSLLKILLTNHCIFDCTYCVSRKSNDIKRTAFVRFQLSKAVAAILQQCKYRCKAQHEIAYPAYAETILEMAHRKKGTVNGEYQKNLRR